MTNTEQIVVRVTPSMKSRMEEYCRENGLSIADMIRCRVLGFLEEEEQEAKRKGKGEE